MALVAIEEAMVVPLDAAIALEAILAVVVVVVIANSSVNNISAENNGSNTSNDLGSPKALFHICV